MASEREQSDGNRAEAARPSLQPPPKPNRPPVPVSLIRGAPAPPAVAEEETTVRVLLGETVGAGLPVASSSAPVHPVPPPLPSVSRPSNQTPVALEMAKRGAATLRRFLGERYARIGAGIFGVGVLVGVVGAVTVMKNRADPVVEAIVPGALAAVAPKLATLAAPRVPALELVRERDIPTEAKAEREAEKPALESMKLPVSGSSAPSCKQLLGKSLAERHDPKRALRETRLGNRALVLGNVAEAEAAFCKALFWDRSNVERHVNLARLFLLRRDWVKAAEYGESALELDPKNGPALGVVGDAWAALNKTKEARAAWLSAEKKPKASPSELRLIVRRNMALAKRVERLRDYSFAERFYRRVLLLEPEHADAMRGIARCLLRVGDQRAAEIWARRAEAPKRSAAASRPG